MTRCSACAADRRPAKMGCCQTKLAKGANGKVKSPVSAYLAAAGAGVAAVVVAATATYSGDRASGSEKPLQ